MTVDEAYKKILELFPDAEIGEDNDSQFVIYTGLRISGITLVPFTEEEQQEDSQLEELKEEVTLCKWCGADSCDCIVRMKCPKAGQILHWQCGTKSCGCPRFVTCQHKSSSS